MEAISIFLYTDYRSFLKDWYTSKKNQQGQSVSFRILSRSAGFRSPNFYKLVMDGKRNLTEDTTEKILKALKLKGQEALYFKNLVNFNQSQDPTLKAQFARSLLSLKPIQKHKVIHAEISHLYKKWYYPFLRELVSLEGFQENPETIQKLIDFRISQLEIQNAYKDLENSGLLGRSASGKLMIPQTALSTDKVVLSPLVFDFQKHMLSEASRILNERSSQDREISSLTLSVRKETVQKIHKALLHVKEEILKIASEDTSTEDIIQINFQMFSVLKKQKKESSL